eukprot:ANDGO_08173.mRNA.1 hypothetical protein
MLRAPFPIAVDRACARWAAVAWAIFDDFGPDLDHVIERSYPAPNGCIFTFAALAAGSFASVFGAALSVVAGNETGGDCAFDVCEAVHATGPRRGCCGSFRWRWRCHGSCAALRV